MRMVVSDGFGPGCPAVPWQPFIAAGTRATACGPGPFSTSAAVPGMVVCARSRPVLGGNGFLVRAGLAVGGAPECAGTASRSTAAWALRCPPRFRPILPVRLEMPGPVLRISGVRPGPLFDKLQLWALFTASF